MPSSPRKGHEEEWDVGVDLSQISRIRQALLRIIEQGRGNLNDIDESGNNIVHVGFSLGY